MNFRITSLLLGFALLLFVNSLVNSIGFAQTDEKQIGIKILSKTTNEKYTFIRSDMYVRENHMDENSNIISFPVLQIKPKQIALGSPIVEFGGGGPGNSINLSQYNWEFLANYYAGISLELGRELILVDNRGVGLSVPRLNCFEHYPIYELEMTTKVPAEELTKKYNQAIQACAKRFFDDGNQLHTYNSVSVAKDMKALIDALGYTQIIGFGGSYSADYLTRFAAMYHRNLEMMILDSPALPGVVYVNDASRSKKALLKNFKKAAEQSWTMAENDFQKTFTKLVNELNEKPIEIYVQTMHRDTDIAIRLDGKMLMNVIFNYLYTHESYLNIEPILSEITSKEFDKLPEALSAYVDYMLDESFGELVYEANFCYQVLPHFNEELFNKSNIPLVSPFKVDSVQTFQSFNDKCQSIGVTVRASEDELSIVETDVPTLILMGGLDPTILKEDVVPYLSYFSDLEYVELDWASHILFGTVDGEKAIARYIDSK